MGGNEPGRSEGGSVRKDALATRSALLDAGIQVFSKCGYERASVRDICTLAGVNVGAINRHFGGKQRFYETLLVEVGQSLALQVPCPQLEDYDRNQISSTILAVSCGGKEGLIPRSKMGATIKKMLDEKGYNPTKVYNNWDYYWRRAKEMDRVNGTNCLG